MINNYCNLYSLISIEYKTITPPKTSYMTTDPTTHQKTVDPTTSQYPKSPKPTTSVPGSMLIAYRL